MGLFDFVVVIVIVIDSLLDYDNDNDLNAETQQRLIHAILTV